MMKLKGFKLLLVLFFTGTTVFAQYKIKGLVISSQDSSLLKNCEVYLNDNKSRVLTNAGGEFEFKDLKSGTYRLFAIHPDFSPKEETVILDSANQLIILTLNLMVKQLEEVIITEKKTDFGFGHLRSVQDHGIYEGKKSEVIVPEQLVANLATNNARQIYSRVAGLNIYENEGAGLQLSIGGRGLDPNRSSNFNVRQNGYDISADALGYPESYYTPPIEAVGQIQILRGASSLQYGTQFGGLINFIMKKPVTDKKMELVARQSLGSYGFSNSFLSASGKVNKLSYYTFAQYKTGKGWRPNTDFNNTTFYGDFDYQLNKNTAIGVDLTHMDYLAHQPGGLTDAMFQADPRQSNRERNWFGVKWDMLALHFDHKLNSSDEINVRLFGLSAYRYSLGFRPNRVATVDDYSERDLIKSDFSNWGTEARYLKRYNTGKNPAVGLIGIRYYHGYNHTIQGPGSKGIDADFDFVNPEFYTANNYKFPNRNVSFFAENIFNISPEFSITPGLRYEIINTRAEGFYSVITHDLAGNVISNIRTEETRHNPRQFLIGGIGLSYKPTSSINIYSNLSQNYRSITFSDMRTANPSATIDPDLSDEKGYSFDLGIRSDQTSFYSYDLSAFYLNYNNRIGEVQYYDSNNRVLRERTNIGQAIIMGIESYAEADFYRLTHPEATNWRIVVFSNLALIRSDYRKSQIPGVKGKELEFVPGVNFKTGTRIMYKNLKGSFQFTHLSDQYTDATNARDGGVSAVVGLIPAYSVMDAGLSYQFKQFKLEASVNNLANEIYFTRRATGYPGPGILPSDGRSFYFTLQVKL